MGWDGLDGCVKDGNENGNGTGLGGVNGVRSTEYHQGWMCSVLRSFRGPESGVVHQTPGQPDSQGHFQGHFQGHSRPTGPLPSQSAKILNPPVPRHSLHPVTFLTEYLNPIGHLWGIFGQSRATNRGNLGFFVFPSLPMRSSDLQCFPSHQRYEERKKKMGGFTFSYNNFNSQSP